MAEAPAVMAEAVDETPNDIAGSAALVQMSGSRVEPFVLPDDAPMMPSPTDSALALVPEGGEFYAPTAESPTVAQMPPPGAAEPEAETRRSSPFESILKAPTITMAELRASALKMQESNIAGFTVSDSAGNEELAASVAEHTRAAAELEAERAAEAEREAQAVAEAQRAAAEAQAAAAARAEQEAAAAAPAEGPSPFDSILKAPSVTMAELRAAAQKMAESDIQGFEVDRSMGNDALVRAIEAPTKSVAAMIAEEEAASAAATPVVKEPSVAAPALKAPKPASTPSLSDSQFVSLPDMPALPDGVAISDSMVMPDVPGLSAYEDAPAAGWNEAPDAPRKIMIVDDSPTVCKIVSITLKKRGYQVMTAGDGVEAMAQLATAQPDLILLDITMPRMDGYQLCKLIKGYPQTKHIPVVMLSGKDGFFDRVRGKLVGCADYLTKPFDPEGLVTAIERYLPQPAGAPAL